MTSAEDAIEQAYHLNKKLAAQLLMAVNDLTAQVDATQRELTAPPKESHELSSMVQSRLDLETTQLENARKEYRDALDELEALKMRHKDAQHAAHMAHVHVGKPGDPLSASDVDKTLARVREHAENLEAQVSLNAELDSSPRPQEPAESPEEKARRQLNELKAARKNKGS